MGVMRRRLLCAFVAALALACPAQALAQSAGDQQYQDPFAPAEAPAPKPRPAQQDKAGGTPTPAPSAPVTPLPTSSSAGDVSGTLSTETDAAVAAQVPQLPRTGADPTAPALAGLGLLAAGLFLRSALGRLRRPHSP